MKSIIIPLVLFVFSLSVKAQQEIVDFEICDNSKMSISLTLETICILDSISEKIWLGWNAKEMTYFLGAKEGNVILVNPYFAIPDGFKKYEKMSINNNLVYVKEESNIEIFGSTNYVIIDRKLYSTATTHRYPFPYFRKNPSFGSSLEYYISVQIHEGFHVYQKPKLQRLLTVDPTFYFKPKIMVYSFIEGMLLLNALKTNSKEEFLQIVYKFITVRNEKNKKLNKRQIVSELNEEFGEGTAQYIQTKSQIKLQELKYQPQILSPQICAFDKAFEFQMVDSLEFISSIKKYNIDSFWDKCYYYGQAQAYILDRLCDDSTWQLEIMEEATLWDLILKYSEYEKHNMSNINEIKEEYQFDSLLRKVRKMSKKKGNGILE
jgi:hypothetical protein